jgi:hypothetical protein
VLKAQFEAGKIRIAEGLGVIESLKKVRYAADGTIDLSTVDGSVRSMALVVEYTHDRDELKQAIPLVEIQNTYFTFLDQNFGPFYEQMQERGLTPHGVAVALSREPSTATKLTKNLPDFLNTIGEFWKVTADAAHAHVEDMTETLKGVFGGDLFPSRLSNLASRCGVYTDTIILPDPFLRSKHLFERWTLEKRAYYLVKHGLNLLQYRGLACADVTPPIVVVLPDITALEEDEKKFIASLSEHAALTHAGKVFGRAFASVAELMEYSRGLDSLEKAAAAVAQPDRLLFDTEWRGSVRGQIVRAISGTEGQLLGSDHPGVIIASSAFGRMGASTELLIKARRLRGTPIIEAPTSWQYFVWKLEYDAQEAERAFDVANLHILRGLQALADGDMEWLGDVPPEALIEIRKTGAIKEIRGVLGRGVEELATVSPADFQRTAQQVVDNMRAAFEEHRKRVAALTAKKWKFAGTEIGSWLVVGSLGIAAAATGTPAWGLAYLAADQVLDPPKLKEIPKSIQKLAMETQQVKKSPVGILFGHARKK